MLKKNNGFLVVLLATVLVIGLASSCVQAAPEGAKFTLTIYVDAVKGKDSNDGLSEKTPLATLNAAQVIMDKALPEDKVILMLARGSVWREAYEHKGPGKNPRYPTFCFGLPGLTIKAYGKGDKPTISGYDIMPNDKFARPFPDKYPNIWSQKLTPPPTYRLTYIKAVGIHPGVLVGGNRGLVYIWTPLTPEQQMRDQPLKQTGIESEEDALKFVNDHPGSFYPRDNSDGTVDYFLNSGSDPTKDKLTYEYKVRGAFFIGKNNTWENIRYLGLTHRDGVSGQLDHLRGVEFLYGITHNMLISEGHFEDVLSVGLRPSIEGVSLSGFGTTGSLFHTHGPGERGIIYDRCTAINGGIAFFDHRANTNRPAAILRDCKTEQVSTILAHGACTLKSFIVGHRHQGFDGTAYGSLGGLTTGENYIEDSIFRFKDRGGWHAQAQNMRVRNSVFYMPAGTTPIFLSRGGDFEYENVTLILDFGGRDMTASSARLAGFSSMTELNRTDAPLCKWKMKNCVIAVVGAPNMKKEAAGQGTAVLFTSFPAEFKLENCVLTYIGDVPETAGKAGTDYVFAAPEDIFAGDPGKGNYTLKVGGVADKKDAGYKAGRKPVYRLMADKAAAEMPF